MSMKHSFPVQGSETLLTGLTDVHIVGIQILDDNKNVTAGFQTEHLSPIPALICKISLSASYFNRHELLPVASTPEGGALEQLSSSA